MSCEVLLGLPDLGLAVEDDMRALPSKSPSARIRLGTLELSPSVD